jgi:hypothetical protein
MDKIILSSEESAILEQLSLYNISLADLLKLKEVQANHKTIIHIDHARFEEVRTILTELLAKVGFDIDYNLTKEGEIIEDLIDRLYI